MKYSILITALLALAVTACNKEEDATLTSSTETVTPDQATPVMPAPAAPAAETAPAPEAAPPAATAPEATAPAEPAPATAEPVPAGAAPEAQSTAPAAAQGTALSMEEGTALAKKSGCFACHNVERKIIGPSWNDIGAKYKGDPAARAALVKWIHTGGTGRWGTAVMPPYSPRVTDADIEKLADFILSLPKS